MQRQEILRYLGYGQKAADDKVTHLIEECRIELEQAVSPGHTYQEYPLALLPGDRIDAFCFQTRSEKLSKNLRDCHQILLFAATLGIGADQLIGKYSKLQMSKAVVMQAAATVMIEEYCDRINEKLKMEYASQGLFLRPRFSPGYGDFPLECQPALIGALEAGKKIGITLTDSLLMLPSKSVTAVIGISRVVKQCALKGCQACEKQGCIYRRE